MILHSEDRAATSSQPIRCIPLANPSGKIQTETKAAARCNTEVGIIVPWAIYQFALEDLIRSESISSILQTVDRVNVNQTFLMLRDSFLESAQCKIQLSLCGTLCINYFAQH